MTIDSSVEFENAFDSIRFNDDGDSNEIDESDSQYKKHDEQRISIEHGITIDCRPECENASDSIRFNDDGDSNGIVERDFQPKKQDDPIILIKFGMRRSYLSPDLNI
jgi:hypothetical protein